MLTQEAGAATELVTAQPRTHTTQSHGKARELRIIWNLEGIEMLRVIHDAARTSDPRSSPLLALKSRVPGTGRLEFESWIDCRSTVMQLF